MSSFIKISTRSYLSMQHVNAPVKCLQESKVHFMIDLCWFLVIPQ